MLLSKKDTPVLFVGMWYAGLLNILVSYINIYLYNINGGAVLTIISAIFSLMIGVIIFVVIKRRTQKILWDKLTNTGHDSEGTSVSPS